MNKEKQARTKKQGPGTNQWRDVAWRGMAWVLAHIFWEQTTFGDFRPTNHDESRGGGFWERER